MFEISGWRESFVDMRENLKGRSHEYFSSVVLSCISRVIVAASQSFNGDLETTVMIILFCVIKCSAISLRFSNWRSIRLFTEVCGVIAGIIGETITAGEVTTGAIGCVGVMGSTGVGVTITGGRVGAEWIVLGIGCVGTVGVITGCMVVVHVVITGVDHVFTVGILSGTFVLLL